MAPATTKPKAKKSPECARCGHSESAHNLDGTAPGCKLCQCLLFWTAEQGPCLVVFGPARRKGGRE